MYNRWIARAFVLTITALIVTACTETQQNPTEPTAQYSAVQGAKKYELVGPFAVIFCSNLEPVPWENTTLWQEGFVRFNMADGENQLSAVVSLKGAAPNTSYPIRLIQGGSDCFAVDGTLTTNGQGNGTLQVSEAGLTGRAQVIIDTGAVFGSPTYRGTDIFTW